MRRSRSAGRGDVPEPRRGDRRAAGRRVGARRRARHRAGAAGAAGRPPTLVTTIPVDTIGGGGLTGLVLSPAYAEDQLVYAYVTTSTDNRVVKLASGEPPKPVFVGDPAWGGCTTRARSAVDSDGSLLVATGDAGINTSAPGSLAGKVLRDRHARTSRHRQSGPDLTRAEHRRDRSRRPLLTTPPRWPGCRTGGRGRPAPVHPRPLPAPAWRWPDRPGVGGCAAHGGTLVAQTSATATYVLRATRTACSAASRRPCSRACTAGSARRRSGRTAFCGSAPSTRGGRAARLQRRPRDPHPAGGGGAPAA